MGNVYQLRKYQPEPADNGPVKSGQSKEELLRQMERELKLLHKAESTRDSYLYYVGQFIDHRQSIHSTKRGEAAIHEYLTYLAVEGKVSASTQNVALCALLFFYGQVLKQDVGLIDAPRAKKPKHLPVVLSKEEVVLILSKLSGIYHLICSLMYGCGLRVKIDCLTLRVQDIDFGRKLITLQNSKGGKSRSLALPEALIPKLQLHLEEVKKTHERDLAKGWGSVMLPNALDRKYPNASKEWGWQWVFPATSRYIEPKTHIQRRHHLHESAVQKAVKRARYDARIFKHVTPHIFRHSYATHLLEDGENVRVVQELLGHESIETTMVYLHVMQSPSRVKSPLDRLVSNAE
jgi:integron integrase